MEMPDEPGCLEYLVFTRLLDEPILLRALPGDGQGGAGVGAPDARQRGDEVVHTLLVFQPPHEQQFGRPGARAPRCVLPARRVNAVADNRDLGQARTEQFGDLVAHRRRTRDQRIGFAHQPRLGGVHLTADRPGYPAGMPPRFGRMDRGNQWHIIELSERDRGMGDQPVVRVDHVGPPGAATFLQGQRGADHRVAHRQRPGHHVVAEGELVRILGGRDHPDALADFVG